MATKGMEILIDSVAKLYPSSRIKSVEWNINPHFSHWETGNIDEMFLYLIWRFGHSVNQTLMFHYVLERAQTKSEFACL